MGKEFLLAFVLAVSAAAIGFVDEAWPQDTPERPYRYVSLDEAVPEEFDFFFPVQSVPVVESTAPSMRPTATPAEISWPSIVGVGSPS